MLSEETDPDPSYTKICSQATLQSKKEGFFLTYAASVQEQLGQKWIQKIFGKLKTDEERISICYRDEKVKAAVLGTMQHVRPLYRPKDPVVAQKRLLEGHQAMSAGNNAKAVVLFTQALLRALPVGSEPSLTLPHSLASRSEALFELGRYKDSIQDIKLAIKEGYPHNLRYQLYWRMARCHRNLGEIAKARVCLQLSLKLLDEASSKDKHSKSIILEEIESLDKTKIKQMQLEETQRKPVKPGVVGGENPLQPGASALLRVETDGRRGRHCVSGGHLAPGDCVVAENPYAAVLLLEMGGTHCHHCFQRLEMAVGCPTCSGVAFCSESCRDSAISTYHSIECRYLGLIIGSGMSVLSMLALRIISQEPQRLLFFRKFASCLSSQKEGDQHNLDPHLKQYLRVWQLETHSSKRSPEDLFQRTLMAIFLLRILKDSGKFFQEVHEQENEDKGKNSLCGDELLIGSLLLHHLQLLQFNAHELFETVVKEAGVIQGSKTVYIGVGLYPTVSLFNHDCNPALARYYVGSTLILRVLRPIKPGAEVPENYGPLYTKHSLSYRRRQLYCRYWFHCTCSACCEDWADMDKLPNNKPRFRKGTGKRLPELNKRLNELLSEYFEPGLELMEQGDPVAASELLGTFIQSTTELGVKPPHRETQLAIDALRFCLANTGNVFVAKQVT